MTATVTEEVRALSGHARVRLTRAGVLFAALAGALIWGGRAAVRYQGDCRLIGALKRGDGVAASEALRHGASANAQSYTEYWSPDDYLLAVFAGSEYKRYSLSALMLASIHGNTEVARDLIRRGAHVNKSTTLGDTALTYAVKHGHADVVELLLSSGADPLRRDRDNETASSLARKLKLPIISGLLTRDEAGTKN